MKKLILLICALFVIVPSISSAHPGGTDSYGGHYCWTNCTDWGEVYGAWHYHGLPNSYYSDSVRVGVPMDYETLHTLMKGSAGYKKVKNGYKVYDILTCKDRYTKKDDKCEKPKAKKLKASKESKSLSSEAKNEKVRFVNNVLKKKRFVELEDLKEEEWKKYKKEILRYVPKSEIKKYAPKSFLEENEIK